MTKSRRFGLLGLALSACAADDDASDAPLRESTQAIIYGNDDRVEVYQHPDPIFRGLAQSSVVALIPRTRFAHSKSGDFAIFTQSLSDAFNVCTSERFADEPTAADCTGVLIDDDLVLTAAHCFPTDDACGRYAFMFDYFFRATDELEPMGWADIYGCRRVVARTLSTRGAVPRLDYAVIQLDRAPAGRIPVVTRTSALAPAEPVAVIGCTSGLPLKIDTGGQVLDPRDPTDDYFLVNSDTFQGSSGSGVFDGQGQLLGVLVRGGDDYKDSSDGGCKVASVVDNLEQDGGTVAKVESDGGMLISDGEEATYVGRAIEGVCATGWPSPRLCGTAARCGDGFCSESETRTDCPQDCACVAGACLDGGNYPAAASGSAAQDKSRHESSGCSALPGQQRSTRGGLTALFACMGACLIAVRRSFARARALPRARPRART